MNAIFNLPTKSSEDGIFATLPDPVTVIPREKPVSWILIFIYNNNNNNT